MRILHVNENAFWTNAFPARLLLAFHPTVGNNFDGIIGYDTRKRSFDIFASKEEKHVSMLCITYDSDTDELEMVIGWVKESGRKCLFQYDGRKRSRIKRVVSSYMKVPEKILAEAKAQQQKMENLQRQSAPQSDGQHRKTD